MRFIILFLSYFFMACEFVGMCPSDTCTNDLGCSDGHICVEYQCVIPCESIAECPAGDGDTVRCMNPQGALPDGMKICADSDGVPGQRCELPATSAGTSGE
jgi:hypothetical protein